MGMYSEIDNYTLTVYTLKEWNFDFGLNDYPIFDENYRATLNNAILEYYMFREIGFQNPAVFRQRLRNRMDIIMRNKYNSLYSAKAKEFNPLYTLDVYEEYSHNVTNENNGEVNFTTNSTNTTDTTNHGTLDGTDDTTSNSSGLALSSQFPSEEMTEDDLSSNLFIDSANKNTGNETSNNTTSQTNDSTSNTTGTNTGTDKTTNTGNTSTIESYNKHSYGSASDLSFAHAMTQFKDYCDQFNLDQQVIDELKDLFIQIW